MYSSRGVSLSDIGDIEIFPHGGELHLFHLTLPNHDVVQHLISRDGLSWQRLPNAIRTGDPGACDDDQIWTMSVTEHDGRFFMLYTALSLAEDGRVQRTALATSDDLIRWTKSERNPCGEADARWYETAVDTKGMVSWRDPKPIRVGDTYYAAVCAREKHGPFMRRGAVGLMVSADLERWEVRPPLFAPRSYWDLECPQIFTAGGRFYLTAGIMEDRTQRYWVAEQVEGPYRIPADGGILAPIGHYAGRVCEWQGQTIYACWHQPQPRDRNANTIERIDWVNLRNPHGKFIVPPITLEPRPDGSLARRSFHGWSAFRGDAVPADALKPRSLFFDQPDNNWLAQPPSGAMEIVATSGEFSDFLFEGTLTIDAATGGIGFRLDEEGGGYFVSLQPGRTKVTLEKWLPKHDPFDDRPWFNVVTLQEAQLAQPFDLHQPHTFQLLSVGEYIEFSLDGDLLIATLSGARRSGHVGIHAMSGEARAEVALVSMSVPSSSS